MVFHRWELRQRLRAAAKVPHHAACKDEVVKERRHYVIFPEQR
jgi:hypothetical protein